MNWYFAGILSQETNRINQISVSAWNGSSYALARAYYLSYTTGVTGYSLLSSVSECSPTQCFPATTIGYQNGTGGWNAAASVPSVPATALGITRIDLNGDGIDDIIYSYSGLVYYLIGQASGTFLGPYSAGANCSLGTTSVPLNFYGNKKISLLEINSSSNWRVCSLSSVGAILSYVDTTTPAVANSIAGDVDGDGFEDIVYIAGTSGPAGRQIRYNRNLGNGTGFATNAVLFAGTIGETFTTFVVPNTGASVSRRIDFNGDGRDDFMFFVKFCTTDTGLNCTSTQWQYYWRAIVSASNGTYVVGDDLITASSAFTPIVGDFNGDGCTDVAMSTTFGTGGNIDLYFGACDGQAYSAFSGGSQTAFPVATYTRALAADWDGDGRSDLLLYNASTATWGYALASNGFATWTSLGIPTIKVVGDFNGDGLPDLAGGSSGISYWLHAGVRADLATAFTDGFGVNYSPTYATLSTSSAYTKGTGATFPEIDYQGATWIVPSYTASDGIGGTYTVSETYFGARLNVQGRGFEGFQWKKALDSRNGLYLKDSFNLTFPLTGQLSERTLYQSNGSTPISDVANTTPAPGYATLDSTGYNQRYFPYVAQSVASSYEVGGTLNGSLITQKTTVVAYAGTNGFAYGNPSQITTTTVDKDSTSPWYTNTFTDLVNITPHEDHSAVPNGWCIGLTDQVTDKRTQPSGSNITRTQSYSVSADGTCRLLGNTVEPSSTTGQKVATTYSYTDGCNNINSISVTGQNPDGTAMAARTTSVGYGSRCLLPETVTNALSQSASTSYRYDLGLAASATDPNNLTTSITYNDVGQKTLEQRPDGTQTSLSYTGCSSLPCWGDGNLRFYVQRSDLDSTSGHASYWNTSQYFDQFGRLKYDEPMQSNGALITRFVNFDNRGRVVGRTNPYGNGFSSYTTTLVYDSVNRVTQEYRPTSATNPTLEYTNYTYQGRTQTVQDPKGYTTKKQFDVIGELLRLTDPDGTSQTNYGYGPFGNLASISDPSGNLTSRSYDALGYQLTGSSDSDRGSWTYQYDSVGELLNLRDAKTVSPSWTQQLTYDGLGRPLTRVETEGTTTWTWGTVAANHEIGQLVQLSGLGDIEAYTFDAYGRTASHTQTWNSTAYAINYAYNTLGKLDTLTYPSTPLSGNRFQVKYAYTNGYLSALQNYTGGTAGTTFWQLTPGTVNMDPWGHVIDETLGTTTAVRIQSAFDAVTSWIGTRQVGSGGSSNNLQSLSYAWDLNGNLSERKDVKQSLTEDFAHDNLNRLQSSTLNGTQNLSVTIDPMGNVTQRVEGGVTYPYTYDTTHKHAVASVGTGGSQTTYGYDGNGNMSTRNGYSISWSTANLPTTVNGAGGVSAAFAYGPDRQRKQQTATYANAEGDNGTETTTYVAGLFEIETTPAQTHYKHFVQVPGGTQIIYDLQSVSGTQVTYVTSDHLGSGNLLLSSAGTTLINESYSAYGYRRSSNWSGPLATNSADYSTIASTTRRGYTDAFHEMLDNVGLIHMNGRVYDPVIGRFLSADPVVARIGNSQAGNPYSYAQNRPLTLTDPTGLSPNRLWKDPNSGDPIQARCEAPRCSGNFGSGGQLFHYQNGNTSGGDAAFLGAQAISDANDAFDASLAATVAGFAVSDAQLSATLSASTSNVIEANVGATLDAESANNQGVTGQVGITGSASWPPFVLTGTLGVAVDSKGNMALYAEGGGGRAATPDASVGGVVHVSNAPTVADLGGAFTNVSAGGGNGAHVTGDAFFGTTAQGEPIIGTGGTVSFGEGVTSSVTYTGTILTPSFNPVNAFLSWICGWAICGR